MEKNNKVTIYLILVIIIVAIIIGGIVMATKQGKKQTKESEIKNNTTNTSQNRTEDYEKNRGNEYDYDNPETMYETYSHPDAFEGEMGVYMVKKDEADFDD